MVGSQEGSAKTAAGRIGMKQRYIERVTEMAEIPNERMERKMTVLSDQHTYEVIVRKAGSLTVKEYYPVRTEQEQREFHQEITARCRAIVRKCRFPGMKA